MMYRIIGVSIVGVAEVFLVIGALLRKDFVFALFYFGFLLWSIGIVTEALKDRALYKAALEQEESLEDEDCAGVGGSGGHPNTCGCADCAPCVPAKE